MTSPESVLYRARKSAGLSMAALGKKAGTSAQQIDRLEKGSRPLSRAWAERIAPHVGLTAQDLMFPETAPPNLPNGFSAMGYDARRAAIVAFLRELAGDAAALEWSEILADVEAIAEPQPGESSDRPNPARVATQARALAVAAKRRLRRSADQA
jgi:transcriptional regulator with XRE-family HTH domain